MSLTNYTPVRICPSVHLTTTPTLLYTVPEASYIKLSAATLTNTSPVSQNVTVHIVPKNFQPATSNHIISGQSIASNTAYTASEMANHTLLPGDMIYASATTASTVNFIASGVLFS